MTDTKRECSVCREKKDHTFFAKDKTRPLGIRYICKSCSKIKDQKYRERRRKHIALWRKDNPEKVKEMQKGRYAKNPTKGKIEASLRHKRAKQALPKWANKNYIKLFYQIAQEESEKVGYKVTVDHIVPLRHPLVCGLHNEFNLQFLSASENSRKRNKFEIGV